jgi:hypothetical protein
MQRRQALVVCVALLALVILSGCQSSVSKWSSNDSNQLATIIRFPFQPQRVQWQSISLPVNNGEDNRSISGPTDMTGVVAILTFDEQTLESLIRDARPLTSDQNTLSINNAFIFDWYPQALRDHLISSEGGSTQVGTLQGYSSDPFLKSSTVNTRGSFFIRIPDTTDIFLLYQSWLN